MYNNVEGDAMVGTKHYNSLTKLYCEVNYIEKIKAITFEFVDGFIDTHGISILYQQLLKGLSINSILILLDLLHDEYENCYLEIIEALQI